MLIVGFCVAPNAQAYFCDDVPLAATFESIRCRMFDLEDASVGLVVEGFDRLYEPETDAAAIYEHDAERHCRAGQIKQVKWRLGRAANHVRRFAHNVRAHRRSLEFFEQALEIAAPLGRDLRTLRRSVRCPEDAPDPLPGEPR
jgi:hypothetical protein